MFARSLIFLLVVLGAVAALVGCGSGGGDGAGGSTATSTAPAISTSSLSKNEFVAKAEGACQAARKNIWEDATVYLQQHEPKANPSTYPFTFAGMVKTVILPIIRSEIAAIRRLGAPAGDEGEVEAFVNSEQEIVAQLAKRKRLSSSIALERSFAPSGKLARTYGLEGCANG
jgi:hypothetical protein